MRVNRAVGKRFVQGLEQHRDQQAQQDHDAAGKLAEAHRVMQDDDALQGGAER